MKTTVAILFALALVFSQPLAASVVGVTAKPCCVGGGVKKCCASNPEKSSREIPGVPAQNSAQNSFPALLLVTIRGIPSLAAADDRVAASNFAPSVTSTVPLFSRDCAYLL